jgi:hypothetical protein
MHGPISPRDGKASSGLQRKDGQQGTTERQVVCFCVCVVLLLLLLLLFPCGVLREGGVEADVLWSLSVFFVPLCVCFLSSPLNHSNHRPPPPPHRLPHAQQNDVQNTHTPPPEQTEHIAWGEHSAPEVTSATCWSASPVFAAAIIICATYATEACCCARVHVWVLHQ